MTPKEKAKEIYCKYKDALNIRDFQTTANPFAKQCALIAVNSTIQTLNEDIRDLDVRGNVLLDLIDYWREVKQEIEKL